MGLQLGIVGLPNVGKSTLFSALTKKMVPAENYAFTTIEPNVGIVQVPDERIEALGKVCKSEKLGFVTIRFVDIAGLVKGASQGEGLGNTFLSHIREVDAIIHVVRAFTERDITHVHGGVDPKRDYDIITTELALADLGVIDKRLQNLRGRARTGEKAAAEILKTYMKIHDALSSGKVLRDINLTDNELAHIADLNLLTLKPELVVWNVDEKFSAPCPENVLPICANIEAQLADLPENESAAFLAELGWKEPGLHRLIKASYTLLRLITFFAAGPKETRGWPIIKGTKAPQAAGKIHTDFEKGFIRMEVINWKDYIDAGSEAEAKSRGKMHLEGKDYVMQDGDVVYIRADA